MRDAFRLNRVVSCGSLKRVQAHRRATSHNVARFSGVAVWHTPLPVAQSHVRHAPQTSTPNATPLRRATGPARFVIRPANEHRASPARWFSAGEARRRAEGHNQ